MLKNLMNITIGIAFIGLLSLCCEHVFEIKISRQLLYQTIDRLLYELRDQEIDLDTRLITISRYFQYFLQKYVTNCEYLKRFNRTLNNSVYNYDLKNII